MTTREYLMDFASASSIHSELAKRFEAVALRLEGWTLVDVADELGCSERSISRWSSTFSCLGVEGLSAI